MINEFFTWWLAQLRSILPASLRHRLQPELCWLCVDVDAQQIHLHARFRGKRFDGGYFDDIDDAQSGDHREQAQRLLAQLLDQLPKRPDRILLRFAHRRYLRRELDLPAAAADDLNTAIEYQIEQLTPFRTEQVVWFSGVQEKFPAANKLRAWLVVVPRERLQSILDWVGIDTPQPIHNPVLPAPEEPLELIFRRSNKRQRHLSSGRLWLSITLILLFSAVSGLHLQNLRQSEALLQDQLRQVRIKAAQTSLLRERIQAQQEQARILSQSHMERISVLALWDDLTQRIDDDTWLQRLDLRDNQLSLQGLSSDTAGLIGTLQASPLLSNVRYAASVTRDRASDKERFNITAEVKQRQDGS